ncbi:hypothetical protein [Acidicapsa ligni]|uniref:hypothetical protein n=1 Tax=Acidicapsa ligni TaxID=542300 RepID=UPI0021E0C568|nr:hypothetical protein [Acidicapsa ligni]
MTGTTILRQLRSRLDEPLPLPGHGETCLRHAQLWAAGVEDLSFARIAEAHWDAVSILAEAGRKPKPDTIYGVWASEVPGHALRLEKRSDGLSVSGTKMFCSGAGLVDRALITVGAPEPLLVDVDLRARGKSLSYDCSAWATTAFNETNTGSAIFDACLIRKEDVIEGAGWYLNRPGFWHGACGPAACWAGGAESLVLYALRNRRHDAHTLAHVGAMQAAVWAMRSCLDTTGREIDTDRENYAAARVRALTVRHIVEQHCTDILRRFARAYGPFPLAMDSAISKRYHELDLYLRQFHAERDLEELGALFIKP